MLELSPMCRSLLPLRPLAYTTVLTILDRLARKGAVTRVKQGKAYVYAPSLSFELSRQEALTELCSLILRAPRAPDRISGKRTPDNLQPSIPSSPELQECLL